MAFGFRGSLGLVTVIPVAGDVHGAEINGFLSINRPTVLPCLTLKLRARDLCFQIIVGT
jgi:hypothetical protein